MKQILLTSILLAIIFLSYFLYEKYQKNIEIQSYAAIVEERALLYSLLILDKQRNTNHSEDYLKSSILFDLRVVNKYNHIKDKINLERYCTYLKDIQKDLTDNNITIKSIFHKVCLDSTMTK